MSERKLTPQEYNLKALLVDASLTYDAVTHTFRGRSPEGSNYTYSRCFDADTLKPIEGVIVRERERVHFGHNGKTNSVSLKRSGLLTPDWGKGVGYD